MVYLFWAFIIGLIIVNGHFEEKYRKEREDIEHYMKTEYNKKTWLQRNFI